MLYMSPLSPNPPVPVVWRNGLTDERGDTFDVDQDLKAVQTKPSIERDEAGRIIRMRMAINEGTNRQIESLGKKYPDRKTITRYEKRQIDVRQIQMEIKVGNNARRLAIKMCAGLTTLMKSPIDILNASTRAYLIQSDPSSASVRITHAVYDSLEKLIPPLSHSIYVEGNNQEHRLYALVQYFGLFQLYVQLNENFQGMDFAYLGTLDWINKKESFLRISSLLLPATPITISLEDYASSLAARQAHFHKQLQLRASQPPMETIIKDSRVSQ